VSLVTPTRRATVTIDGERVELRPGVSRLHVRHQAVADQPGLFRVCDVKDTDAARELAEHRARNGNATTETRAIFGSRPSWKLERNPSSRLPARGRKTGRLS
jgi:hypothetical protein